MVDTEAAGEDMEDTEEVSVHKICAFFMCAYISCRLILIWRCAL